MSRSLLLAVLMVALALRLWGAFYDLPYIYHPDEPHNLRLAQTIFKSGDLNPHWFEYPSLFYYINAAAYVPYYLIGKGLGLFAAPTDLPGAQLIVLGTAYAPLPSVIVLGRLLSIFFGLGVVWLVYLIGRRLAGPWVGLLGALFVAVSSVNVSHSRFMTPDTSVTFWSLATLLAATSILQDNKTRAYVLAAVAAGPHLFAPAWLYLSPPLSTIPSHC